MTQAGDENPLVHDGPELLYVQLADHIERLIRDGRLRPGSRLPAERHLAEEYGVSYDTVRKAAAEMRKRGLIRTVHGRGTYVLPQPPAPQTTE